MGDLKQIARALGELCTLLARLIVQTSLQVIVPITQGGTGATTAGQARTNLAVPEATGTPWVAGNVLVAAGPSGIADSGVAYTTGSWTPALEFGGAATGITYSDRSGVWSRIGNEVWCQFTFELTNNGSATGDAAIAGLPHPVSLIPSNKGAGGMVQNYDDMIGISSQIVLVLSPGATDIGMVVSGAVTSTPLTEADFSNTAIVSGQFRYRAA